MSAPRTSRFRRTSIAAAAALALAVALPLGSGATAGPPPTADQQAQPYRVTGVDTVRERTAIVDSGLDVMSTRGDTMELMITPAQVAQLTAAGYDTEAQPASAPTRTGRAFPSGYTGYTDYNEMISGLNSLASANPNTVRVSNYGTTQQGRRLVLVKLSDNVGVDENEPEVLFTCGQHAREHLTVEQCMQIANRLARNTAALADREIWIMPNLNPDGAEYDHASGQFRSWRKNRVQNSNGTVGTDLNRNWGHQWGCCRGSSTNPGSDTYRGTAAFSAPETAAVRNWVNSRVIGGRQQITTHIDWHTYSELILWPYGYTTADTAPGLDATAAQTFRALGEAMASTNGYEPQQASDLYITDGSINDWMWAAHGIWSYTFEMYPTSQFNGGFYPRDTVIARETARNDPAVDLIIGYADCVPRIIGRTC